jgi:hypothetical protein
MFMGIYDLISDLSPATFIFIAVVVFLIVLRILMKIILYILSKLYIINRAKRIKNIKECKVAEKINENIASKFEMEYAEMESKIVGFAKPVGMWSSLVLGDEITKTLGDAMQLNEKNSKGFWKSVAEAQARNAIKKG